MLTTIVAALGFAPIDNSAPPKKQPNVPDVCAGLPKVLLYPVPNHDVETSAEHVLHCGEVVSKFDKGNTTGLGGAYMTPSMHAAHCRRVRAAAEKVALTLAEPSQEACSLLFPAGTPGGVHHDATLGVAMNPDVTLWKFETFSGFGWSTKMMIGKLMTGNPGGKVEATMLQSSPVWTSKDDSLEAPTTPQWNEDGSLAGMNACSSEVEYLSAWYSSPLTLRRMAFALKCSSAASDGGVYWNAQQPALMGMLA